MKTLFKTLCIVLAALFLPVLSAHAGFAPSPDDAGALGLGLLGLGLTQNFPTLGDFRQYMVNKMGSMEVIRQSLYDSVLYPTAGAANIPFFQNPIGASFSVHTGAAAQVKGLWDTNMTLAGQLPAPQGFWIESIELIVLPGSVSTANTFTLQNLSNSAAAAAATVQSGAHDVNAILSGGSLTLTVGTKPYLQEASLLKFPPKCRMELDGDLSSNSATAIEVVKETLRAGGRPYYIDPGVPLMTSQNFGVTLNWPVAVATPSGFNAKIMMILDGWLFRAVQ